MIGINLEKNRIKKDDLLMRFQIVPKMIVKIHSFEELNHLLKENPDKIIVIYFWAPWCASCTSFKETFIKVQIEYPHDCIFVKVNVDINQEIVKQLKITGVPTVSFMKGDKLINKIVGVLPYNNLKIMLEKSKSYL